MGKLLFNPDPPPDPKKDKSFMQVRPKAGEGSPAWYSPERDLVHNFPNWIMASLRRFEEFEPEDAEGVEALDACGVCAAGKKDDLQAAIKELQDKNPEAFASVSSMFSTYLWWKFWEFAGDVSLRKDVKTGD